MSWQQAPDCHAAAVPKTQDFPTHTAPRQALSPRPAVRSSPQPSRPPVRLLARHLRPCSPLLAARPQRHTLAAVHTGHGVGPRGRPVSSFAAALPRPRGHPPWMSAWPCLQRRRSPQACLNQPAQRQGKHNHEVGKESLCLTPRGSEHALGRLVHIDVCPWPSPQPIPKPCLRRLPPVAVRAASSAEATTCVAVPRRCPWQRPPPLLPPPLVELSAPTSWPCRHRDVPTPRVAGIQLDCPSVGLWDYFITFAVEVRF